ncbi:hypothetical protein GCM10010174_69830 [Kutzneria viridogrisea]|uniref:Uncharacterized protein n=1 Tax=Kutzneria viridogrisea TaxID=47990 RepID=A0ABR6BBR7_9PSEU|nr:hypothetical protein [Kutzneria viridogrisea]
MALEDYAERCRQAHAAEVERGEHDAKCEYGKTDRHGSVLWLCHCSMRRRHAAGHTEPPGELEWQNPICPRCSEEVELDGDSWTCPRCRCVWDSGGREAEFYDEYGDITPADEVVTENTCDTSTFDAALTKARTALEVTDRG